MRTRAQRFSLGALFILIYMYCFPYFEEMHSANELPRVYLSMSIWDDGEFYIDKGVERWGGTADTSPHGGHTYSNKAPGSSFLAVPAYVFLKSAKALINSEPSLAELTWTFRFFTGVLPSLLFLMLLWRFLGRFAPAPHSRRLLLTGYALGTMAMTYSVLFVSHQLAAICIGSAYILSVWVFEEGLHPKWLWCVGLLAGCAPLVDYQAAFAGVPIAVYILYHTLGRKTKFHFGQNNTSTKAAIVLDWKYSLIAILGALPPILLLFFYHDRAFGNPFSTGYSASESFAHFHQQGFLGMDKLRWEAFSGSLFSLDNGLLVFSPMLLLAIPGWLIMARRKMWGHLSITLSICIIYLLFISSINFWRGGWQVGPRYIVAMLPFLLVPIAVFLSWAESRWIARGIALGFTGVGLFVYTLSSATFPHFPENFTNPLFDLVLRLIGDNAIPYNAGRLIGLQGTLSLLPYFLLVLLVWLWVCYPTKRERKSALLGGAITIVILLAYSQGPGLSASAKRSYQRVLSWIS